MKTPKLTISVIITILTALYSLLVENAEILNIDAKTLTIISTFITAISIIWKALKPNESVFTTVKKSMTRSREIEAEDRKCEK